MDTLTRYAADCIVYDKHKDRERDRERTRSHRDSHDPHSYRDSRSPRHRGRDEQVREGDHSSDKGRRGGWIHGVAEFLKHRIRPQHGH